MPTKRTTLKRKTTRSHKTKKRLAIKYARRMNHNKKK